MRAMYAPTRCVRHAENQETSSRPSVSPCSLVFSFLSWPSRRIASLSPRMKFPIDSLQPVQGHMRVNLAGGNIGMAQNCLHCTQVRAVFHHVRGATVAQHVWTGVPSGSRCLFHHLP